MWVQSLGPLRAVPLSFDRLASLILLLAGIPGYCEFESLFQLTVIS
jgi:hypothetical protein